ncbi:MAG: hypothetical protein B7X95_05095 [Methylophilaceae bacterium 17-44-8]|nr:MAG: hypothetical protein B7X95_05095 [Methylophilaceae bacterium 17-44-8]
MAWVKGEITLQDCRELATRLRDEDRKEVLASKPDKDIVDSLYNCKEVSYKHFAVMEEGLGCIAIFGIRKWVPENGRPIGVPWFLCSEDLFNKSCRAFIRQCKDYLKEMTDDFYYCFNYVATSNTKAHHWLKWMGFTINKTETRTLNGVEFYPFIYLRNDNV